MVDDLSKLSGLHQPAINVEAVSRVAARPFEQGERQEAGRKRKRPAKAGEEAGAKAAPVLDTDSPVRRLNVIV